MKKIPLKCTLYREFSKLFNITKFFAVRQQHSGNNSDQEIMKQSLPHFAEGEIVRGFGRGSKELGIPTANFPLDVVKNLPPSLSTGIYYGWASVDYGKVYKMVMSVGWNPFYENKEKSMETHIMHEFSTDLYGSWLKVCIVGYLRPEKNFDSLESLIEAIRNDINEANTLLENNENLQYKECPFFKGSSNMNGNDSKHPKSVQPITAN